LTKVKLDVTMNVSAPSAGNTREFHFWHGLENKGSLLGILGYWGGQGTTRKAVIEVELDKPFNISIAMGTTNFQGASYGISYENVNLFGGSYPISQKVPVYRDIIDKFGRAVTIKTAYTNTTVPEHPQVFNHVLTTEKFNSLQPKPAPITDLELFQKIDFYINAIRIDEELTQDQKGELMDTLKQVKESYSRNDITFKQLKGLVLSNDFLKFSKEDIEAIIPPTVPTPNEAGDMENDLMNVDIYDDLQEPTKVKTDIPKTEEIQKIPDEKRTTKPDSVFNDVLDDIDKNTIYPMLGLLALGLSGVYYYFKKVDKKK